MKFCRNCGSALSNASQPNVPAGMLAPSGPIASPPQPQMQPMGGMPHMPSPGPMGPQPGVMPPPGPFGPPPGPFGPPPGAMPLPSVPRPGADLPATLPPSVAPQNKVPGTPSGQRGAAAAPPIGERTITCPRCGTPTPMGFAYCQQCGLHMSALQPTDPGAGLIGGARPRSPSSQPVGGPGNTLPQRPPSGGHPPLKAPIDPQAATMASDGPRPNMPPSIGAVAPPVAPMSSPMAAPPLAAAMRPSPSSAPAWGTAVLVNRDGSDGQRYPLAGEYLVVGRAGADIAFDDDRFLARQHARIERAADGSVMVLPIDLLNGVFRKADAPIDLADGTTVLVGREVLRFERVDAEEAKVHPLVRHGVALFGSPPREPWGRLLQIIPSGGYRDVRHLVGEEIVLGREEGDIVFRDDAFMSRRHAAVTWDGKRAQITDLGSSNGTFVRVTVPTPIKHGDHVRMGDQLLRIELGR